MLVQQQQDASIEWQSRLSQVTGTVVTDNSGGTGLSRSERQSDLLRQRRLLDRVETVRAEEHSKKVEEKRDFLVNMDWSAFPFVEYFLSERFPN